MKNVNEMCDVYCGNNMYLIKKISYPMISKIGGITESDYDDFYSIANATVYDAAQNYVESKNDCFEAFLKECLSNKFKTEMTRRNRQRRIPTNQVDRLDAPFKEGDYGSGTMGDLIPSKFKLENEISLLLESSNVENYLNTLSPKQKKIALLVIDGYELPEIQKMLHMSNEKMKQILSGMRTFDKRIILKNHTDDE